MDENSTAGEAGKGMELVPYDAASASRSELSSEQIDHPPDTIPKRLSLLGMPGEIRNLIYEFALSASDGVQSKTVTTRDDETGRTKRCILVANDKGIHTSTSVVEFNQLQYVNKQLRAETTGLELQFNPITIEYTGGDPQEGYRQLTLFKKRLDPPKLSWLTSIVEVGCRKPTWRPLLEQICTVATNYVISAGPGPFGYAIKDIPQVTGKYVMPDWKPVDDKGNLDPHMMMSFGVFLSIFLYEDDCSHMLPDTRATTALVNEAIRLRGLGMWSGPQDSLTDRKMNVYPMVTGFSAEESENIRAWLVRHGADGEYISKWFHYVNKWIKDGL